MSLGGIDLNLLVALEALLTECNVTRAAERTSVGQPAMSASLSRLRRHFNDPLLVRDGRGLVPTPLAESLIHPVHDAIEAAEAVMSASAVFDPSADRRTFTVVASDYVTLVLLSPLFADLAVAAPGVGISVEPLQMDFADQLRSGRIDLLIVPTAVAANLAFPHTRLFADRYLLACDRDNPDVGETVTPAQFSKLPYLSYSIGRSLGLAETELAEAGIHRNVELRTHSFVLTPFLLTGSRMVSMVHERLALRFAEQARLRLLEPPMRLPPIVEAMYWSPRHTDDPAHRWLRDRITEIAESLP
ncbi:LysR family transcriptional regulator [Amycolatopsis pigmentata]|uniref:LysR family transcriptional regulator n=1 Tax=Amycolatopsis pigmentata TaxID=450801 RepID=A0ABW5FQA4_9PSEU